MFNHVLSCAYGESPALCVWGRTIHRALPHRYGTRARMHLLRTVRQACIRKGAVLLCARWAIGNAAHPCFCAGRQAALSPPPWTCLCPLLLCALLLRRPAILAALGGGGAGAAAAAPAAAAALNPLAAMASAASAAAAAQLMARARAVMGLGGMGFQAAGGMGMGVGMQGQERDQGGFGEGMDANTIRRLQAQGRL